MDINGEFYIGRGKRAMQMKVGFTVGILFSFADNF